MIYNTLKYNLKLEFTKFLNINPTEFHRLSRIFKQYYNIDQTDKINEARIFPIDIMYYFDFCEQANLQKILGNKIISRIINGKALLVFHFAHEGFHPGNEQFEYDPFKKSVVPQLIELGIPFSSIYFITGDLKTHQLYNETVENINFIGLDVFGDLVGNRTGRYINTDFFDDSLKFRLDKNKDFLYLNGCPRPGKCLLKYALEDESLLDNSLYSWLHRHKKPDHTLINHITSKYSVKYRNKTDNIFVSVNKINELDANIENISQLQDLFPKKFIQDTIINLVPETSQLEPMFFITEKTYKCMLFKQPFLLWANPFMLKYLRSLGYVSFSNIFDETYDVIDTKPRSTPEWTINNSLDTKIDCIIQNLKNFKERSIGKEKEVNGILDYNFNLLKYDNPSVTYNKLQLTPLIEKIESL